MNRMYRYTRHVYDLSRRYYLLGRDDTLAALAADAPATVLEIGCGTGRNLLELHELLPTATLYGLDAATVMLDTARRSIDRHAPDASVRLAQGLAESFTMDVAFGRPGPVDAIVCSYVLSMLDDPRPAIDRALAQLRPGGALYIVDFWDIADWPAPAAALLRQWLGLFGVRHRPALHMHLHALSQRGRVDDLVITPIAGRYAYRAVLRCPPTERGRPPKPSPAHQPSIV